VIFRTLSTRIAVTAGFFVLISVAGLSFVLVRSQREQVLTEVIHGSESIADAIRLSIQHDMRLNRRDGLRAMIEATGEHPSIEAVRVFNKNGRISFSSRPGEIGAVVPRSEPACVSCHSGSVPARELDAQDRSRTYQGPNGQEMLATIRVIRNGAGCQGSGCHASPEAEPVLGILDVAMTLEPAQERLAQSTRRAILLSIAAVLLITIVMFLIISRSVRQPIRRMVEATRRVMQGSSDVEVPRGAATEIRILATAMDEMVHNLNSSQSQLEQWASQLEDSVSEKAQELKEAQFQVVHAEKLASVGQVAAGIAHELNSPLMAINTFAHLVRQRVPDDEQAQEDLRMIEKESNRCAVIVRQLLDYSRKHEEGAETELCTIDAAINGALNLLKVEIQNDHVDLDISIPDDLPPVEANQVQLMQIFVNLMINAIHAMPEGGSLAVTADVVARDAVGADLPPHPSRELVRVSVEDTGTGIPEDKIGKVFDPFFTTKPVGQGSGLGLSVSLGLVRSYRGTITVESDGETGTTFTVLLPVARLKPEDEDS
jgi:two-component system NtrC family sensor kinase